MNNFKNIEWHLKELGDRLDGLIYDKSIESGKNQGEQANEIGVKNGSLSKYKNIDELTIMRVDSLLKIASYYDVSADYLLALSNVKDPNNDAKKAIGAYIGLNDDAINTLHKERDNVFLNLLLNFLINNPKLIRYIGNYFLTGIYDEYFESDFKTLPLKSDSLLRYKQYATEILFSRIIESLPSIKDKFLDNINENELIKKRLFEVLAKNNVNVKACCDAICEYDAIDDNWGEIISSEEIEKRDKVNAEFAEFLKDIPAESLVCEEQKQEEKKIEILRNFLENLKKSSAAD